LELIKDYELEIHYHPSKVNVAVDVLSRKSHVNMVLATELPPKLCAEFEQVNLGLLQILEVHLWRLSLLLNKRSKGARKRMRRSRKLSFSLRRSDAHFVNVKHECN
jgi:hypothetical protein